MLRLNNCTSVNMVDKKDKEQNKYNGNMYYWIIFHVFKTTKIVTIFFYNKLLKMFTYGNQLFLNDTELLCISFSTQYLV